MHEPKKTSIRSRLANFIDPQAKFIRNIYNEAFMWGIGGGETKYETTNDSIIKYGYNINPLVYSIVNQMATKTASIPFYVKKVDDKTAKRKLDGLNMSTKFDYSLHQKIKSLLLESKAFTKEDLPFPMERPNSTQTWAEFLSLYKTFIKTTGNAYIYMLAPEDGVNAGTPIQVYLLPSQFVQIVVKNFNHLLTTESPIDYYILVQGKQFIQFEAEDVIHVKYSNPNFGENGEHLYGMSPLKSALKNIESSNSALDLNIKTLKSGGAFGFIHGKKMALNKDQASEIKERLQEMNSSPEDLSKIAGISAEVGFTRLSLTSDELKPFDYLAFDEKQISNVLIWPIDDGNRGDFGGTINEIRKQRITDNIIPDLDLLSQALNTHFLPRFKGYEDTMIVFDAMELPEMQTNIKELTEWLNNALDRGIVNRDEYRAAINYLEIGSDAMKQFTVKDDIIGLEEALENDFNVDPVKKNFSLKAGFKPGQNRDENGQWTDGGGKVDVSKELEKEFNGVTIDIYQNDKNKVLTLSRVIVPKDLRDKGLGTKFMESLINKADSLGFKIILTPSSDFGGDKERLKEFYQRFGFVFNKGENRDFSHREDMYRLPKNTKAGFNPNQQRGPDGQWGTGGSRPLTEDEKQSLNHYTDNGYKRMNSHLLNRQTASEFDQKMIDELKAALEKEPPPIFKGKVWRGMTFKSNSDFWAFKHDLIDGEIEFRTFVSTTQSGSIAQSFTQGGGGHRVVFEIESLTGRDVQDFSMNRSEEEVLFSPGSVFKVLDVDFNSETARIKLREEQN